MLVFVDEPQDFKRVLPTVPRTWRLPRKKRARRAFYSVVESLRSHGPPGSLHGLGLGCWQFGDMGAGIPK